MLRLVSVLVCALLLACGGSDNSDAGPGPNTTPDSDSSKSTAAASPTASGSVSVQTGDESIAFQTEDGATIKAHLYSVLGPRRRVLIFTAEDQNSWRSQARAFSASGVDVFLFDFRGRGENQGSPNNSKLDLDLEAAVRFLKSRDYPLIYVIAADLGCLAAIKVAARQELAAIVGLDPPLAVDGPLGQLDARTDLANVREPKLFVLSSGYEGRSGRMLLEAAPQPRQIEQINSPDGGTKLLATISVGQLIRDFVLK